MYIILGIAIVAVAAFLLLTLLDLIKYLIRSSRDKKKGVAGTESSFPKVLKRNLILLPIGIAVVVVLYFVLPVIFPVK